MNGEYNFTLELRAAGLLSRRMLSSGFGQNFLIGEEDRRRVARCALDSVNLLKNEFVIIEIGAGPGGLTSSLFDEGARKVIAIEQDRQFIPMLNKLASTLPEDKKLDIVMADARKLDFCSLANSTPNPDSVIIVGNLPYSAATAILQNILNSNLQCYTMALMFQREVAQRICAKLGEQGYARLSVLVSLRYRIESYFDFAPEAFFPIPKVFSRVVSFKPYYNRESDNGESDNGESDNGEMGFVSKQDYQTVCQMTGLLFSYRRKRIATILRNASIKNNSHNYNIDNWYQSGEAVGVDFSKRAEDIDAKMWLAWARALNA